MSTRLFVALALALAVGLATAVSPFASSSPDGLNKVASEKGFATEARPSRGPIAGYEFPGIADRRLARGVSGFAGTIGVFALGWGFAYAVRRRPVAAP
jgi:hypothetical protein